ncbi:ankyrin repeat domain-containing protein 26-like [Phacochoerus africanus]|uniref:ankyrin repeat domain-containing protein 26-like n=1 Tax=Phacochoerus africanus TaxID=41426 RepID=UPI001FD894D2|nr:ankyrin repeat domain-containing protein 26-like [Phacochoerus africanus]
MSTLGISTGQTAEDYALLSGLPANHKLVSEYKERRLLRESPSLNGNSVCESSEEDSLSRFSNKPGADDPWPTSDKVLDFDAKSISESLPEKYADHLPGAAGQIGKVE